METDERTKGIEHVFNAIKDEIEKLGLEIRLSTQNKHGEELEAPEVDITDPDNKYFSLNIDSGKWGGKGKSHIFTNTSIQHNWKNGKYLDGSPRWFHHTYYFMDVVPFDELERMGFYGVDCRMSLDAIRKDFKSTKNPKLIIKDVLPIVERYRELTNIATEIIEKRIEKKQNILEFQNKVSAKSKYGHQFAELKTRSFDFDFGEITVYESGKIELKKEIEESELWELLG